MSLENQIATLNDNITKLIAVLGAGAPLPVKNEAPKADKAAPKAQAAQAPANDAPKGGVGAPVIPYDEVKAAILNVSAKLGRDAAVGLLKPFGVAKGTDLKVEQYAAVLEAAKALLPAAEVAEVA